MVEAHGDVEYDESGAGPTLVFVPGSCSTGAAWRPVIAALNGQFRCVTTSLLGYGGTAERRTPRNVSMAHEVDVVEAVIRRAGGPVHLVGHSFGGLVSVATALRNRTALASLTVLEAPAMEVLREYGEWVHYSAFRKMADRYFKAYENKHANAITAMIDFYGGEDTFACWSPRLRAYAIETTAVNIRDWATAFGFPLPVAALAGIDVPALIVSGSVSHPAAHRANALLSASMARAEFSTIDGAAHFMIATHADRVAELITKHVRDAIADTNAS